MRDTPITLRCSCSGVPSIFARLTCVLLLGLSTTACIHAVRGGPESMLKQKWNDQTATATAWELNETLAAGKADEAKKQRNRVISQRLMMIDDAYADYVRRLQKEQTAGNLGMDLAGLALGVAGTLTGSAGAKTNYAAASTLLSGSSAAINRRAFFEQTTTALVSAMNAFRATVRLRILKSSQESFEAYPPEEVYFDLTSYEFAGSLLGAISFVQTTAEDTRRVAETRIDASVRGIVELTPTQRVTKQCLTDALGTANKAALTQTALLQAGTLLVPPVAMAGMGVDEMRDALQDRIRHALVADLDVIGDAFATAKIADCKGG